MKDFIKSKQGKITIVLCLLLLLLAAVTFGVLSNREEGYRSISIKKVVGSVFTQNGGIEYEAYPNMKLGSGYTLSTKEDSYTRMVLDEYKYVKLEENSIAIFEELGTTKKKNTVIRVQQGVLTTEITAPLPDDEEYIVNTPNAILAVRGTMFKVQVFVDEIGDYYTNVLTYGGVVACKRVMPDGSIVDEEVLIPSGYKAKVKMDEVITFYVEDILDEDEFFDDNIDPLEIDEISDDDLVDIFNASANGHDMFLDENALWEEIENRNIDISGYESVYDGNPIRKPEINRNTESENGNSGNSESGNSENGANNNENGYPETEIEDISESETEETEVISDPEEETLEEEDEISDSEDEAAAEDDNSESSNDEESENDNSENDNSENGNYYHEEGEINHTDDEKDISEEDDDDEDDDDEEEEDISEEEENNDDDDDGLNVTDEDDSEDVENYEQEDDHTGGGEVNPSAEEKDDDDSGEDYNLPIEDDNTHVHKFGEYVSNNDATCTRDGTKTAVCEECGEEKTVPDEGTALGHYVINDVTDPTCTESGSVKVYCKRCDYIFKKYETPAKGHNLKTEHYEPTCTKVGKDHTYCIVCGEDIDTTVIPAKGHVLTTDTVEATCTEDGSIKMYCTVCNEVLHEDIIPAKGHTEVEEVTEATYVEKGHYKRYCSVCEEILEEYDIDKLPALYTEDGDITITSEGYIIGSAPLVKYTDDYTISQRDSSTAADCVITVESGEHNVTFDGVNIETDRASAFVIDSGAEIDLTVDGDSTLKSAAASSAKTIYNNGTLKYVDGTLNITSYRVGIWNGEYGTIDISGGEITISESSDGIRNYGTIDISGGTVNISSDYEGIWNNGGTIDISGGTVNILSDYEGIWNNGEYGTIDISGGTVNILSDYEGIWNNGGTIDISGGEITISESSYGIVNSGGTIDISGGSIEADGSQFDIYVTSGSLNIMGGSVRPVNNLYDNYGITNENGDTLTCFVYDEIPTNLTFPNSDGTTYEYKLTEDDAASDGKFYVWKYVEPFNGTLYTEDGDITITSTGVTQGDGAEIPWTEDYVIAQRDSGTAVDCVITIESGEHNITFDGVNVETDRDTAISIAASATLNIVSDNSTFTASKRGLSNSGTVYYENGNITLAGTTDYGLFNLSGSIFIISDGQFTAIGEKSGIYNFRGSVEITDGIITATGTSSHGIYSDNSFTVNGGTITAHGKNGIANAGDFIINGGIISTSGTEYGIHNNLRSSTFSGVLISDGCVEAEGSVGDIYCQTYPIEVTGGSVRAVNDSISGTITNENGDPLTCYVYDTVPDDLTFPNSDGTTYEYNLSEDDAASDGNFYVWKYVEPFDGTIYTDNGDITITDTGFIQGDNAEVEWDDDYIITQESSDAVDCVITIKSGEHNVTFDGVNTETNRVQVANLQIESGAELHLTGLNTNQLTRANAGAGGSCISNDGTLEFVDGDFDILSSNTKISSSGISAHDSSETIISGGNIVINAVSSTYQRAPIDNYGGTIRIEGGYLECTDKSGSNSSNGYGIRNYNGDIVIDGGEIHLSGAAYGLYIGQGSLVINDGTVYAEGKSTNGIFIKDFGSAEINGGEVNAVVSSASAVGIATKGTLTMTAGSVEANGKAYDLDIAPDTLIVMGGSLRAVNDNVNGTITNENGDELTCFALDEIPDDLDFPASDGTTYEYNLSEEDAASDGKFYVWKYVEPFNGTLYTEDGDITITETGVTQGDGAEIPWTSDYTITQEDSNTAVDCVITVASGDHNVTFDGVNIQTERESALIIDSGAELHLTGDGDNSINVARNETSAYGISNDGTLEFVDGNFDITGNSSYGGGVSIVNNGTVTVTNGNLTLTGIGEHMTGSGIINHGVFIINDGEIHSTGGSYGVDIYGGILTINDGIVSFEANGGDLFESSGIEINNFGEMNVTGGSVEAEGTTNENDIEITSGLLIVTGGSLRAVNDNVNGTITNENGDELTCFALDEIPDDLDFPASDGTTYEYNLSEEDAASDGKFYVWKYVEPFDGTIYTDNGDITLTDTGFIQGDNEEVEWDDDYIITQEDSGTAVDCVITISSGEHNVTFDGVNVETDRSYAISISGGAELHMTADNDSSFSVVTDSGNAYGINNGGVLEIVDGVFEISAQSQANAFGIYNGSTGEVIISNGNITISGTYDGIDNEGTVQITDGYLNITSSGIYAYGIYNTKDIIIDGGEVSISAAYTGVAIYTGTMTINDGLVSIESNLDKGLYIYSDGTTDINGGDITIDSNDTGIYLKSSSFSMNGGMLTVTSKIQDGVNINTGATLNVTDGHLIANGETKGIESFYIINISGGIIEAYGNESYGFYLSGSEATITGGTIEATSNQHYGMYIKDVTITGGTITATSYSSYEDIYFSGTKKIIRGCSLKPTNNTYNTYFSETLKCAAIPCTSPFYVQYTDAIGEVIVYPHDDGYAYIWLPIGNYIIGTSNGITYNVSVTDSGVEVNIA